MPIQALIVCSFLILAQSISANNSARDSLILQEIADSVRVPLRSNPTRFEGGRVVNLSFYYNGQQGAIPAAIGGLDSLRHLHMRITNISSLLKEIGLLKNLDTIDIGTSKIGLSLPEEIGELSDLKCLRVTGCKLKALPSSTTRR